MVILDPRPALLAAPGTAVSIHGGALTFLFALELLVAPRPAPVAE